MDPKRVKVAVVAGGDSGEYEISMQSGRVVHQNLDPELFESFFIEIRGDNWFFHDQNKNYVSIDKNDFSLTINEGTRLIKNATV